MVGVCCFDGDLNELCLAMCGCWRDINVVWIVDDRWPQHSGPIVESWILGMRLGSLDK